MRYLFLVFSVFIAGCASVGTTSMSPGTAKADDCPLQIFTNESEVKREFVVACLIDSRTGTTAFHRKNAAVAIEKAKPEACACGADAMIVDRVDTEGASYASWGQGEAIIRAVRFVD